MFAATVPGGAVRAAIPRVFGFAARASIPKIRTGIGATTSGHSQQGTSKAAGGLLSVHERAYCDITDQPGQDRDPVDHEEQYLPAEVAKSFYILAQREERLSETPPEEAEGETVAAAKEEQTETSPHTPVVTPNSVGKVVAPVLDLPTWIPANEHTEFTPLTLSGSMVNNRNWRSRCGCDQTGSCSTASGGRGWINMYYGKKTQNPTRYDIRMSLWAHSAEFWGDDRRAWERMQDSPQLKKRETGWQWDSHHPNAGGYYSNFYETSVYSLYAVMSVEVRRRYTHEAIGVWMLNPRFDGGIGFSWLHCGKDIDIYVDDTPNS